MRLAVTVLTISLAAVRLSAAPATPVSETLDALDRIHVFPQASISPDGASVGWLSSTAGHQGETQLTIRTVAGGKEHTASASGIASFAWAPDSASIVYLAPDADAEDPHQLQLWHMTVAGKGAWQPHRLTKLKGFLEDARWSPDGHSIAVLFTENAPRPAGPLQPETAPAGVIGGTLYDQKIVTIEPNGGRLTVVSPAGLYIYEYDWAPDSAQFVFTAAPPPGDDNWGTAKLYTIGARGGTAKRIYTPRLQIANPRWSPDGSTIAFIEGLMSDEGATGGDIFTVAASGGEATNRTPGRPSSPSWLAWLPSSKRLLFAETVSGATAMATLDLTSGSSETVWKGDESVRSGAEEVSLSHDGTAAALVRSSWTHPPEVWAGPLSQGRQVTHDNRDARCDWGKPVSLTWQSGGHPVQGWLMPPVGFDASKAGSKKYPLVVSVHGGPASARKPSWPRSFFDLTLLSSQGYFVLFPNPRGSYGEGEAFTQANVRDFGHGDLDDILAGVDAAAAKYPIDEQRTGIGGWSYGGFMTMWTVTRTQRFRAAVAGAGIANWQSYYGQNSIDQWMIPYFGATVYDDPAVYAHSSPITGIKNAKTPTLVLVGADDGECPAPQSFEFWHALKTLGVPSELVVYPGEGHAFRRPEHRRDVIERTIRWFDQYLK